MNEWTTLSSHLGNKSLNPPDWALRFIKFTHLLHKSESSTRTQWQCGSPHCSEVPLCVVSTAFIFIYFQKKKCCNWLNWLIDMSALRFMSLGPASRDASVSFLHSDGSLALLQRFACAVLNPAHSLSCCIPGQILLLLDLYPEESPRLSR